MALIRLEAPPGTFARAPLALVACQIHFEPILRLTEADFVAPFQEAVRDKYPTLSQVAGLQIALAAGGLRAEPADLGAWAFGSVDQRWQITLGRDNLTIQAGQYDSYEDLRERFLEVLRLFVEIYSPGARLRLGLRYINRLAFDDVTTIDGWRELVRPELLGLAGSIGVVDPGDVKHAFGQARLATEESQMVVRHGFLEPGTLTHPDVEPPQLPHFVLDMDHFDMRRFEAINPDDTGEQLDSFHEDILRLFRWALTDKGAARLEPTTAETDAAAAGARS
jgi:uncharacterized protein (TIGR04255 family)